MSLASTFAIQRVYCDSIIFHSCRSLCAKCGLVRRPQLLHTGVCMCIYFSRSRVDQAWQKGQLDCGKNLVNTSGRRHTSGTNNDAPTHPWLMRCCSLNQQLYFVNIIVVGKAGPWFKTSRPVEYTFSPNRNSVQPFHADKESAHVRSVIIHAIMVTSPCNPLQGNSVPVH